MYNPLTGQQVMPPATSQAEGMSAENSQVSSQGQQIQSLSKYLLLLI